ncbi:doublesex and mab-3 related transcription factor dmrt [Holotrichia oblita]|uniref:Doublesex and mab-3 related transcription factor dmrt n=1 Tax=Holotrichia oblita TaxID=644536 RepID=A0ACB9T4C0_HOLOL|nr:doublesex and mab-3 related transcription factor dmrt [Holotrichia oblita]
MAAQVALKRQQAAEDAIALHLASAESGTTYDYLPPGRIYGMQVTSPIPEASECESESSKSTSTSADEIQVTPASIDMLCKLFPNKKRAVLELVLKRCNHDLLKAIEHFNMSNSKKSSAEEKRIEEHVSAFKPVHSKITGHGSTVPLLTGSKVYMHSLYPFLSLFNTQPVLPSPVYVPGFCECDQCKFTLHTSQRS